MKPLEDVTINKNNKKAKTLKEESYCHGEERSS
jgi:hypothetical protein